MWRTTLLAVCLCAVARADVLVLDAAGGGDFTTLQQVADVAADGDIVLVRPGQYAPSSPAPAIVFEGRALTFVADGTGPVSFPSLFIQQVPLGELFILRGIRFEPSYSPDDHTDRLHLSISKGLVLFEDCVIVGPADGLGGAGLPSVAVHLVDANAAFESCEITGPAGKDDSLLTHGGFAGNWAMSSQLSRISLASCTLTGGAGGDELQGVASEGAGAGGHALRPVSSIVTLSGCTLVGGAGGHDTGTPLTGGPAAGGAAVIADATSLVWLRDSTTLGGAGGTDAMGAVGPPGADIAGPVVQLAGPARRLRVSAPLIEGQSASLTADGAPHELALALISFGGTWLDVPKFGGPLLTGPLVTPPFLLGVLDGAGHLQLHLAVPSVGLSPGTGVAGVMQLVAVSGGSATLGDASALVLLDAGF
jgi:hypothetical protein